MGLCGGVACSNMENVLQDRAQATRSVDIVHLYRVGSINRCPLSVDPCPSDQLLKLGFAGVSIGRPHEAEAWLQKYLFGQTISFTPLIINSHSKALESIIYSQRKVC